MILVSRQRSKLLGVFVGSLLTTSCMAIYINPTPSNPVGLGNTGPLFTGPGPRPPAIFSPLVADVIVEAGGMSQTTSNGGGYSCSGTIIQSTIMPARDFILTAGHCVTDNMPANVLPNANGTFRQADAFGTFGPVYASDRVRRHRRYVDANLHNDVGLMRLDDAGGLIGLAGLKIKRTAHNVGSQILAVGTGSLSNTGALPLDPDNNTGALRSERYARFDAEESVPPMGYPNDPPNTLRPPSAFGGNSYWYVRGGNGTPGNPTRHICGGDSGGPTIFGGTLTINDVDIPDPNPMSPPLVEDFPVPVITGGEIGGVHSYGYIRPGTDAGANLACFGHTTGQGDANLTLPFLHNWVDSYTRKAIFWDKLRINAAVVDNFEAGGGGYEFGENGFAAGWGLVNVPHPVLGNIVSDPADWRYINAIGNDNASMSELYLDGDSSQGEIMLRGNASVITKTFAVNVQEDPNLANTCGAAMCGGVFVDMHRRWNSLGLGEDVGVGLVGGAITWAGLSYSDVDGGIDQWTDPIPRTVDVIVPAGLQNIRVYLLNVPEPSSFAVLGLVMFAAWRGRRAGVHEME